MRVLLSWLPVQRVAAEQALKAFQEHPEAWTRVDSILEKAKTQQTKYFALQVRTASSAQPAQWQLPLSSSLVSDAFVQQPALVCSLQQLPKQQLWCRTHPSSAAAATPRKPPCPRLP
jgi:hypothetical protein